MIEIYKVDTANPQLLLSYKDIYGEKLVDLNNEIKKLNMHKTLSIISELIRIRDANLDPIKIFNFKITIPFESYIKIEILKLGKF